MKLLVCIVGLLLTGAPAFGEDAAKFEIADVHLMPAIVNDNLQQMNGGLMRGGRYELRRATMVDLITTAYGVSSDRVVGGPSWLEMNRYNVIAKGPEDLTPAAAKPMLRSLLAERFELAAREDRKPMPAFALTAGKRTQLKKSGGSGDAGCKSEVQNTGPNAPASEGALPTVMVTCRRVTMEALAAAMGRMPASFQYIGNRAVVDQTNLDGEWDFTFHYNIRARVTRPGTEVLTMFDALERQLGIVVQASMAPTPVIVVESVNQIPTPNSPQVEKAFPPLPAEFEVATIRATDPSYVGQRIRLLPGGRIEVRGIPLKPIIADLWGFNEEMVIGAPGFSESDRWDIVAKAPATAAYLDGGGDQDDQPPVDIETLFNMVKTLLAQRFKLAVHLEERPMQAYTITALRPKMKKADPAERTRCLEGPAALAKTDARDANPLRGRLMTCYNMSMAQLAEKLRMLANGYVHSPVLDSTGLEGGYDFTLNFSTVGQLRGGQSAPVLPGVTAEAVDDPSGAISLPDAMEKQLGIKMELQKSPVQVLVIDHLEQQPREN